MRKSNFIFLVSLFSFIFFNVLSTSAQTSATDEVSIEHELKSDLDKMQADIDKEETEKIARLESIRTRILKGEDFCLVAREVSEETACNDMGENELKAYSLEYAAALVRLKAGEVSEVIRTDSGFHLVQLVEVKNNKYRTRRIVIKE